MKMCTSGFFALKKSFCARGVSEAEKMIETAKAM